MIKLENISKIYKGDTYEIQALDDVSLEINKGDFHLLWEGVVPGKPHCLISLVF